MATMKKTAWCQVLKFHLTIMKGFNVVPSNFFVMVVDVSTRQKNVMATPIVLMALMNKTAPL